MSFPASPPPQPPYAQQPYRASTRSRIIVWTIAVVLLGTLAAFIGASIYGAVQESARDDKLTGACRQETRRHITRQAGAAEFAREKITDLTGSHYEVAGTVYPIDGDRRQFICSVYWDGSKATVTEFRFS